MSDTATEKEIEVVSGTIKGVIVKGTDKWQVEVQPDGSEYTKKLWTKDKALVDAIPAKIGQAGAFVCNASYWTRNDGQEVRSLWIERPSDGTEQSTPPKQPAANASPSAAPQAASRPPVLGGDKDRLIVRQACLKAAATAYNGITGMEDVPLAVITAAARFETWVYRDMDEPPF